MVPDARARLESAAVPPGEPESLAASRTATSMPALPRRPLLPAVDARARAANVPALHAASEADEVHQESGDKEDDENQLVVGRVHSSGSGDGDLFDCGEEFGRGVTLGVNILSRMWKIRLT